MVSEEGCEVGDVIGTEELKRGRKVGSGRERGCCGEIDHAQRLELVANVSENETERGEEVEEVIGAGRDEAVDVTDINAGVEGDEKGKLGEVDDYVGWADSEILLEAPEVTEQEQHLMMFRTIPFPLVFDQLFGIHLI